jgi:hypothetical protein
MTETATPEVLREALRDVKAAQKRAWDANDPEAYLRETTRGNLLMRRLMGAEITEAIAR